MAKGGKIQHWKHGWIPLTAWARAYADGHTKTRPNGRSAAPPVSVAREIGRNRSLSSAASAMDAAAFDARRRERIGALRLQAPTAPRTGQRRPDGGKLLNALKTDGGFTYDPKKGEIVKVGSVKGIAVARPGTEQIVGRGDIGREDFANAVADAIEKHGDDFGKGAMLGGWYSEDRDAYMVEVTDVFPDRDSAIKAGRERNQEGIFDLGTGDFISTGGTGDGPVDLPGDPMTKGLKYDTPVEDINGMTFSQAAADNPMVKALKAESARWESDVPTVEYQLEGNTVQATEKYLRSKPINKVVSGAEPFREGYDPYVLRTDDGDIIIDGHHRFAMYAAMGKQSAPVKLLDVRGGKSKEQAFAEALVVKKAADGLMLKAKQAEPQTTRVLEDTAARYGGRMEGLKHRLKAGPSLARKIRDKAKDKGMSPEEYATNHLGDSLRYTMVQPEGNYTAAIDDVLNDFRARGYSVVEVKNTWPLDGDYKGVNTTLRTPEGVLFELQFHTEASLAGKEANHKDFELARDASVSATIRKAAVARMVDRARKLPVPANIAALESTVVVKSSVAK